MSNTFKAKNLTKEPPRSPYVRIAGFALLGRTIDKCRAFIAGTVGEYTFNCPVDREIFGFKGIDAAEFKAFAATGATDEEIGAWVHEHGVKKTDEEIKEWSDSQDGEYEGIVEDDKESFAHAASSGHIKEDEDEGPNVCPVE